MVTRAHNDSDILARSLFCLYVYYEAIAGYIVVLKIHNMCICDQLSECTRTHVPYACAYIPYNNQGEESKGQISVKSKFKR